MSFQASSWLKIIVLKTFKFITTHDTFLQALYLHLLLFVYESPTGYATSNTINPKPNSLLSSPETVSSLVLSILVSSITVFPNYPNLFLHPRIPHISPITKFSPTGGSQIHALIFIPAGTTVAQIFINFHVEDGYSLLLVSLFSVTLIQIISYSAARTIFLKRRSCHNISLFADFHNSLEGTDQV